MRLLSHRMFGRLLCCVMFIDLVEDGQHLVEGGDADQRDAEVLEVEEAAEVGTVVLAHFEDGLALALEVDGGK